MNKLIVFGSRTLSGEEVVKIIKETIKKYEIDEIITAGGIKGVCLEAQKVSKELALPVKLYWPNFIKYKKGAFHHRSLAIIKEGNTALLIHDGISKGTANELKLIEKIGIKYQYCTLQPEIIENEFEDKELDELIKRLEQEIS